MPVVAAYLLDTHLNLDRSRPGESREKPHTSRLPSLRKRIGTEDLSSTRRVWIREQTRSGGDNAVAIPNRCVHQVPRHTRGLRRIYYAPAGPETIFPMTGVHTLDTKAAWTRPCG